MRDHTKLQAFHLADGLALTVYRETASLPRSEIYGLQSQMRRAAVSIAANIVEGCSRSTQADYARFVEIAYGSARELQYQISLCERLRYLSDVGTQLQEHCTSTAKALNGLLRALRS